MSDRQYMPECSGALPFDRDAVYPDHVVREVLSHLPESLFVRARRTGALRFSRHGHHVFYRGDWILDWLLSDANLSANQKAVR